MRYLIFGAKGQLGREFVKWLSGGLVESLKGKTVEWIGVGREECDISDLNQVLELFESTKPNVVVNCAAYNLVDKAEEDYVSAVKVNSVGVRNLAFACNRYRAFLVHYSTDYVFDGKKENALYIEDDKPNPLNEYGKSKLIGEEFIKEEIDNFLILRVSWVYGEGRQNFIYKLLKWAENNDYLKISYDEISVPTSTRTIVDVTLKALKEGLEGLYHLTNSGYASRYEWAKKVFKIKKVNKFIYPVSSEIFNLPAKRPKFSAMSNEKVSQELNIEIPSWEEELVDWLNRRMEE
ncbi:dTDP-4-dehydrorhamnose reductase [Desulfurobacterium thermolithotrophum DSM 11699]|uniref:dTDP-4-dehydrorhamnose reductase n=1 Tax=Desulfurobacterium thermolithotrophum (strain DSM 11699 / BSA) TaxID=868864 RepID=F0S1K4_DESTD|nr:dTDP-4-dehydrorhamnose reductase [Desulfurobacterium thermolithotrophum]ADY74007.1 dTDP-4-dehydrorhamnose reductase [Desulfurobacterium thermolithotrophum DSM 11699]